jgi:cytochrome c2
MMKFRESRAHRRWRPAALVATLLALAALPACGRQRPRQEVEGGDAQLGRQAIQRYGCGTCHIVPGVPGAEGRQAQMLVGFGDRADIVGAAENTPDNLIKWIREPQSIEPRTKMPALGVTEKDARDIAAYLFSLRAE